MILPSALSGADAPKVPAQAVAVAPSGGEELTKSAREAKAKQIEEKIGREGLTLADQIRGTRELRQRLWNDPQRPRYHLTSDWGTSVVKEQAAPFELLPGEPLRLRVFLDRSVLEVYANGRQCITQRIYPSRADSLGVALITRGGSVKVKSLDAWDISPVNSW